MNRQKVLEEAVNKCMKELYSLAQPKISWEDFIEENRKYLEKEKEFEKKNKEYLEPKPYEFYYLPNEILEDVTNSYIYAYKLDEHQNLLDIIEIIKNYCNHPLEDKQPKLEEELTEIVPDSILGKSNIVLSIKNKFFEFLDKIGKFYKWNSELQAFNMSIYLGASPSSNKESVIENWKKYRNIDIKIDEEQIKREYYGEDK